MSFFSWFSSRSSPSSEVATGTPRDAAILLNGALAQPDATDVNISFEDIITSFDSLNQEVLKLRHELHLRSDEVRTNTTKLKTAQSQNQKHETTIRDLRKTLQQEKKQLAVLQEAIVAPQKQKLVELRKQGPTQGFIKDLAAQRNSHASDIASLRKTIGHLNESHGVLQRQLLDTEQRLDKTLAVNRDLKLDLEYLKCTSLPPTPRPRSSMIDVVAPLPEIPFILVLVDGDAYRFDMNISRPTQHEVNTHPATRVARNIKNYVQAYTIDHDLPPHCKLFVRALRNASGARRGKDYVGVVHRASRTLSSLEDFMITFTESAPLFDFIDAGTGKERVDGKIHELYHTFVPNPSCKKIFLAASSDNGFARMLEQYADRHHARAKTCLIDAGNMAREIQDLHLETVEWPSVFARQFKPRELQAKNSRREARRQAEEVKLEKEQANMISTLGKEGYNRVIQERAIAQVTMDLTGSIDTKVVVAALLRRDGDRRKQGVRVTTWSVDGSSDTKIPPPPDTHDAHESSYCIEDGVD